MGDRVAMVDILAKSLSRFGFTGFVMTALSADWGEPSIVLNGWPPAWLERYLEAGHYASDPCARHCMTTADPFTWNEIPRALTSDPRAARVREEAGDFGFADGLCVPLHSIYGLRGMSMAGAVIELPPGARRMAQLLSVYACSATERSDTAAAATRRLTRREREVLKWTAVGRTANEVADILTVSAHTVKQHLKNIRRKLATTSNVHSVVEALRLGDLKL